MSSRPRACKVVGLSTGVSRLVFDACLGGASQTSGPDKSIHKRWGNGVLATDSDECVHKRRGKMSQTRSPTEALTSVRVKRKRLRRRRICSQASGRGGMVGNPTLNVLDNASTSFLHNTDSLMFTQHGRLYTTCQDWSVYTIEPNVVHHT